MPFESTFTGGVTVALGDFNGDKRADLAVGTGVGGGGPRVVIFGAVTNNRIADFFAYDSSFRGGVNVGAADLDGDGRAELLTGVGEGGGPHAKAFKINATPQPTFSFFAFESVFRGGVLVGGADIDGDGRAEWLLGVGPGGGLRASVRYGTDPTRTIADFFGRPSTARSGLRIAGTNIDGTPPTGPHERRTAAIPRVPPWRCHHPQPGFLRRGAPHVRSQDERGPEPRVAAPSP